MKRPETNWRWGTPEGGREFDRLMDAPLSFREKIQWIEETEALHERLAKKLPDALSKISVAGIRSVVIDVAIASK